MGMNCHGGSDFKGEAASKPGSARLLAQRPLKADAP